MARLLLDDVPGEIEHVLGDFDVLDVVEIFRSEENPNTQHDAFTTDGRTTNLVPQSNSRLPRSSVIRNRSQVVKTSAAIIVALQEALDYDPKNPPQSDAARSMARQHKEYIAALQQIVDELKTLNQLLKKNSSAQKENNSVVDLGVHVNQFLKGFSSVAGKGTGWLLIASLGGLLYQTGIVPDLAESVFRHIKLP